MEIEVSCERIRNSQEPRTHPLARHSVQKAGPSVSKSKEEGRLSDMHPLMVAIITTNTSLSVILWNFLLSQVFCKKIKAAPVSAENVPV